MTKIFITMKKNDAKFFSVLKNFDRESFCGNVCFLCLNKLFSVAEAWCEKCCPDLLRIFARDFGRIFLDGVVPTRSAMDNIRNFSIIAHIDHGKSTLADRLIQTCGGLTAREMSEQVLDSMDLERERGITIKAQTASLKYRAKDGKTYELNLIDTPGHVDFSYEVSRSLSACEGALLVVDATQGVEAQTVANCYTAIDLGVEVVPVLNKMDLNSANPDAAKEEIEDVIGIDATDAIPCSAKTGMGVEDILERIVSDIPPPKGDENAPLQALIIDSWFDNYVGIETLERVVNGVIRPKDKVMLMATGAQHLVEQVGVFTPKAKQRECLKPGVVGFVVSGI